MTPRCVVICCGETQGLVLGPDDEWRCEKHAAAYIDILSRRLAENAEIERKRDEWLDKLYPKAS